MTVRPPSHHCINHAAPAHPPSCCRLLAFSPSPQSSGERHERATMNGNYTTVIPGRAHLCRAGVGLMVISGAGKHSLAPHPRKQNAQRAACSLSGSSRRPALNSRFALRHSNAGSRTGARFPVRRSPAGPRLAERVRVLLAVFLRALSGCLALRCGPVLNCNTTKYIRFPRVFREVTPPPAECGTCARAARRAKYAQPAARNSGIAHRRAAHGIPLMVMMMN